MGADILLLGLGETGASVGLALARSGGDFRRTGYDPNQDVARSAHKAGAVDRLTSDPRREAAAADLVFYSLPLSTLGPALDAIAGDIKSDSILIDMTPLKQSALDSVPQHLRAGAAFVGAVPILGAERVFQVGELQPSADLFQGGLLAMVLAPGTPPAAVEVCTDLAALLGTQPFFLDAAELDAAMAASEGLPVLLAAAYLRSLAGNPAWRDQSLFAARTFDGLTRLAAAKPAADLAEDLAANRANVLRWMDTLLGELGALRDLVAKSDPDGLKEPLEQAASAYHAWKATRALRPKDQRVTPMPEMSTGSRLARMLGFRLPRRPRVNEAPSWGSPTSSKSRTTPPRSATFLSCAR